MVVREIIKIDEEKCTGCGECIPNCHEGALQIINGKATLVSDLFCDGLGACIGHCPEGAIAIEKREAEQYDEKLVMEDIAKKGPDVIKAHLQHLKDHGAQDLFDLGVEYLHENKIPVPSDVVQEKECVSCSDITFSAVKPEKSVSQLRNWPTQLMLIPPHAPFLKDSEIVFAADCVPFAYADFHEDVLKGKVLMNACPKFDDVEHYLEKLTAIFQQHNVRSITVVHMEVPCCSGLRRITDAAMKAAGKHIPVADVTITVKGEVK